MTKCFNLDLFFLDEQIPFNALCHELTRKGIAHGGVEVEDKAVGLGIKIIKFPELENVSPETTMLLQKYILSVTVRIQQQQPSGQVWKTEMVFVGNPVAKISNSKAGCRQVIFASYCSSGSSASDCLTKTFNFLHRLPS